MIDTIIFDYGNVLIDFCWEKCFRETLGYSGETFEKLANATTRSNVWNLCDKGEKSEDEILDMFIENDPSMENEIRRMWDHIPDMLEPFGYAIDWVRSLKSRGYKVYMLSNFSHKAYVEAKDKLMVLDELDGAVLSFQEKLIKPYPEIYKLILSRYNITPENAVFIDDKAENVEAARALGIHGIVFKGKEDAERQLEGLL